MKTRNLLLLSVLVSALTAVGAPVVYNNVLQLHAQTLASFPAPTVATTQGGLLFDTTSGHPFWSDGVAWTDFALNAESLSFTAVCFDAVCAETANFTGGAAFPTGAATTTRLTCAWHAAPTGDGTQIIVAQLWDVQSAAELCSCSITTSCAAAAVTVDVARSCLCASAAGALASNREVTVRLKNTTTCTIDPGQIVCTGTLTVP